MGSRQRGLRSLVPSGGFIHHNDDVRDTDTDKEAANWACEDA